ncbi:MAG: hypothetical protein NTY38_28685 [Acidobacteria bacterium]|nr:hypothetical protein [Acidobacteriota bacterium]
MSTATLGIAPATATPSRWIISRPVDLAFVIGGSLAGYLYLGLNVVAHVPVGLLWWIWSVGFDGTHIFGTATRTYFDREQRTRNRGLLFGSLAFFFTLGPVMVLLGWKGWLALFVGVWAYYHVMRQHYGFLMLYKVKNRDLAPADNRMDRLFLGLMLVTPPFWRFFIRHPEDLGLPKKIALASAAPWVEPLMWTALAAVLAGFVWRQWLRWRSGVELNRPKLLLLAGVVPLHWLTFTFMSWQAAVPTVTIVHNLQYHALIWFYNRNHYSTGSRRRFGRIPAAVSTSLLAYVVIALGFSALYRIPGFQLGKVSDLAFGLFCGFGLTHYYLDSKIWRVRHDPALRQALRLN